MYRKVAKGASGLIWLVAMIGISAGGGREDQKIEASIHREPGNDDWQASTSKRGHFHFKSVGRDWHVIDPSGESLVFSPSP